MATKMDSTIVRSDSKVMDLDNNILLWTRWICPVKTDRPPLLPTVPATAGAFRPRRKVYTSLRQSRMLTAAARSRGPGRPGRPETRNCRMSTSMLEETAGSVDFRPAYNKSFPMKIASGPQPAWHLRMPVNWVAAPCAVLSCFFID
jgi:hypothetical protein